jgi:hypothetical protein
LKRGNGWCVAAQVSNIRYHGAPNRHLQTGGRGEEPKAESATIQYRMRIDKRTEEIMRDKEAAEAVMSLNGLQKRHGVWSDVRQGGDASAMQIGALNQDALSPAA